MNDLVRKYFIIDFKVLDIKFSNLIFTALVPVKYGNFNNKVDFFNSAKA